MEYITNNLRPEYERILSKYILLASLLSIYKTELSHQIDFSLHISQ